MSLREKAAFAVDISIIAALGVVYIASLTAQTVLTHLVHPVSGTGFLPDPEQERRIV